MQCEFERLEARPQALEWIFSTACGLPFRPSLDNLAAGEGSADPMRFARAIAAQARTLCEQGLPPRAARFHAALAAHAGCDPALRAEAFRAERLHGD